MRTPAVCLDAADALELGEMLELLRDWLQTDDEVAASLVRFSGDLLGISELQADLSRFAFLLGGDGSHLVGEP
jgi:hypothetical protein